MISGLASKLSAVRACRRVIVQHHKFSSVVSDVSTNYVSVTEGSAKSLNASGNASTNVPAVLSPFQSIPQTWISSMSTAEEQRVGIIDLNPAIFRSTPRLDILYDNITWQEKYRCVHYREPKCLVVGKNHGNRKERVERVMEVHGPPFGGICFGLRGPVTLFYMLSDAKRIQGLCSALTVKHVQDDLVIIDDFDTLPTDEPEFLEELAKKRNWGYSVLFIHDTDVAPRNLALATSEIVGFEIMPVYGLNCYSSLYFDTLVISKPALAKIDERLTYHMRRVGPMQKQFRYMDYKKKLLNESEHEEDEYHPPFV